jgi:hypothetical protein
MHAVHHFQNTLPYNCHADASTVKLHAAHIAAMRTMQYALID